MPSINGVGARTSKDRSGSILLLKEPISMSKERSESTERKAKKSLVNSELFSKYAAKRLC